MTYLVTYVLIGIAVAAAMALFEGRRVCADEDVISWRLAVGLLVVVAFAWPVSAAAYGYGFLVHVVKSGDRGKSRD